MEATLSGIRVTWEGRRKRLQGNEVVEHEVLRFTDNPRAPAAEVFKDPIVGDRSADHRFLHVGCEEQPAENMTK